MKKETQKKYISKSEIIEKIILYIKENDLEAGEKMPSERSMCKMWSVNRSTLRAALHRLIEDGYLDAIHGKGYFIRKSKLKRNLQDMKSLKTLAREQKKELITKVISQEIISGEKNLAELFNIDINDPILELVRMRYLDGEAVLLEYNYSDLKRCYGLEKVDFSEVPYYTALELKYGLIPHSGYQDISITKLREEEAALFMKREGTPAIYMSGVTFDKSDKKIPIEIFKSISDIKAFSFISHMKVLE